MTDMVRHLPMALVLLTIMMNVISILAHKEQLGYQTVIKTTLFEHIHIVTRPSRSRSLIVTETK